MRSTNSSRSSACSSGANTTPRTVSRCKRHLPKQLTQHHKLPILQPHRRAPRPIRRRHQPPAIRHHHNRPPPRRHRIPPPHNLIKLHLHPRRRGRFSGRAFRRPPSKSNHPITTHRNQLPLERLPINQHHLLRRSRPRATNANRNNHKEHKETRSKTNSTLNTGSHNLCTKTSKFEQR